MNHIKATYGNQRGFTLVELIVSLFLIVLIISTTNTFFVYGLNTYNIYRDRAEVAENLRVGINRLSREVRLAAVFKSFTPANGGRLTFKYSAAGSTISYHISNSGDSESAKQLIRAIDGYGNNPVARYVNRIQVVPVNIGTDSSVFAITLTGKKGRSGSMEISTTVRLRN